MLLMRKQGDDTWHTPQVTAYTNEEALEMLIAQSPHLLPGLVETEMVVVRQLTLPVGYVDIVGVDTNGDITIVECKLKKNPEIRREVIGQVLAYASALWQLSYEEFDAAFAAKAGVSLTQRLAAMEEEWDEEVFRANLSDNLERGRFRLVIVVDQITEELKRIILYLNQHTTADMQIVALELGYIADDGVELLIPAVYGTESVQIKQAKSAGQILDAEAVLEALERLCTPAGIHAARRLYEFTKQRGATFKPSTGKYPTASARFLVNGKLTTVISLGEWPQGQGGCSVYFSNLLNVGVSVEILQRFAERLREIPGAKKSLSILENGSFNRQPTLSLDHVLGGNAAVDQFSTALDELLQTIASAEN